MMKLKLNMKNFCSALALSVIFLSSTASAATNTNVPVPATPTSNPTAVLVFDKTNEDTQRFLAQDMKTFLGLTELKRVESQNVLRLMWPPDLDKTMAAATRLGAAQNSLEEWQETLVRDTAYYNMNTPLDQVDDHTLLYEQKAYCGDNEVCNFKENGNDLLASTLLGKPAFESDVEANAAYEFVRKLTNFRPLGMLPDKKMYKEDKNGKKVLTDEAIDFLLTTYESTPSLTLAQNSFLRMHGNRQPFKELGNGLNINGRASASFLEVLEHEVNRRYTKEAWYKQMNQMSEAAIQREIANMMAFGLYLQFQQYQQAERMEALMAAQIGVLSQMVAQSSAAAKAGKAAGAEINTGLTATPTAAPGG